MLKRKLIQFTVLQVLIFQKAIDQSVQILKMKYHLQLLLGNAILVQNFLQDKTDLKNMSKQAQVYLG